MKLRNKKTGEIITCGAIDTLDLDMGSMKYFRNYGYSSLAELNEEWEDYEELKDFWFIDDEGGVQCGCMQFEENLNLMKSIGNYFETREEAEKAVEKLKAWKRLRDKGFRFTGCFKDNTINYEFNYESVGRPLDYDEAEEAEQDLAFIFGGEE